MFVLVFWIKSKTTSILKEEALSPNADENEDSFAKFENGRLYKVKVLKKSVDYAYLKSLRVTKDGEIIIKKDVMKKATVEKRKYIKDTEKNAKRKKETSINISNRRIIDSKSIFSSESSDSNESNHPDESPIKTNLSKEQCQFSEQQSDEETSAQSQHSVQFFEKENSPPDSPSTKIAMLERQLAEMKKSASLLKRINNENSRNRSGSTNEDRSHPRPRPANDVENFPREHLPGSSGTSNSVRNNDDPLAKCRMVGEGKVPLCEGHNIWLNQVDLAYIQRWKKNPKEMTRRLLKLLVGENNLKNMCARGRKNTNRPPVPEDIITCIEYYVNKKCESSLEPVEFTNVVNFLCGSLRNSKTNK